MRTLLFALAIVVPGLAAAQSLPAVQGNQGFYYGFPVSAEDWNDFFEAKQDFAGAAPKTVATLPTCNAATQYHWAVVTDANSPTYNGTLTGSGSVIVPVFCDGVSWTAH